MKKHRINYAKEYSEDAILAELESNGFNVRQEIGYNWNVSATGVDCEYTQPPEQHSPSCELVLNPKEINEFFSPEREVAEVKPSSRLSEEEVWAGVRSLIDSKNENTKLKALQMAADLLKMSEKKEVSSGNQIGIKVFIGIDPRDV